MKRLTLAGMILAAVMMTPTVAAASIIDFETVSFGATVPFSFGVDGVTASFSSPGTFYIAFDPGGEFISGRVLLDTDGGGALGTNPLTVSFSSLLSSISLGFAQNAALTSTLPFTLTAYSGGVLGTQVGTVTVTGGPTGGAVFPGGTISFAGGLFDTVLLSSAQSPDFAVDNIEFTTATPVPEPASLVLLGGGLAGTIAARRRRRTQQVQ